jgi:hypothetical protein
MIIDTNSLAFQPEALIAVLLANNSDALMVINNLKIIKLVVSELSFI